MSVRKRINMRLPENLINEIDKFCESISIDRTYYFESLARADMKHRGLFPKIEQKKMQYFIGDENIDNMLLEPVEVN